MVRGAHCRLTPGAVTPARLPLRPKLGNAGAGASLLLRGRAPGSRDCSSSSSPAVAESLRSPTDPQPSSRDRVSCDRRTPQTSHWLAAAIPADQYGPSDRIVAVYDGRPSPGTEYSESRLRG